MRGRTAGNEIETIPSVRGMTAAASNLVTRKVWLPKAIYDGLPFFYFISGILAFLATVYINEWFWVLPHYVLFSVACLHFGVAILRRRERARRADPDPGPPPA
jgi:Flp pilus assembly protein TadB